MVKEIVKNNWDFVLYDVNGEKIITVIFYNSFIDTSRSFRLTENEARYTFDELKQLSETIRHNYDLYKDREILPSILS